jgi:hypothetical protein
MNKRRFASLIQDHFRDLEIEVTEEALAAFLDPAYFSEDLLSSLPNDVAERNVGTLLEDITSRFEASRAQRLSPTLEAADVTPLIQARFCKLPPFCKGIPATTEGA